VKIVRRQQVKGPRVHYVYEIHLTVEGPPWRVPGRYDDPFGVKDNTVGLDLGVSSLACVAVNNDGVTQALLVKASDEDKAKEVKTRKKARKCARSLERSRRNNNPDAFKRGKKGKKAGGARKPGTKLAYSNRYVKTRVKQATQARAGALERKRLIEITAAQIVRELGPNLLTEKVKPKQWTCLWGKQIGQFAPSKLMKAIETEAVRAGGSLTPFPTNTTALSQTCLCGKRVKKPLSQRTHTCGCVTINGEEHHRDLFSAFLATSVTKTQKPITADTSDAEITSTDLNPEEASWVWTLDTSLATTLWVGAGDAGICLRSAVSEVNVTRVSTIPDPIGSSGVERVALKPDCFTDAHKVVNTSEVGDTPVVPLVEGSVEGMRKVKNIKEPVYERRKTTDAKTSTKHRH
jgi:hypothetical protein